MTKYITGKDIIDNWNIRDFQLFDYVRRGLMLFKKTTGQIFECPAEYNLATKLENIDQWIAMMEHPNFPDNLENYWDEERLTMDEHPILLDEMYQIRAKIIKKLEPLQSGKNINDMCSWYYCDLPDSEQKALALINSVVDSLYLKSDVMEILGPPKKGSKLKILGISNKKKPGPDQIANQKCKEIAKRLWDKDKFITIADMINEEEIVKASTKENGKLYTERTVRNWINDLCPNRMPGRRPKK